MKFTDDKSKNIKWYNRNFLWFVSLLYCVLLILLFLPTAHDPIGIFFDRCRSIENMNFAMFNHIKDWLQNLVGLYSHSSWSHVLHNCLGFLLGSIYIERKYGSFNFLLILLGLTCLCSFDGGGIGNSYIWFALWGFVLVDFLWPLSKKERNKTNIIFGIVTIVLEYVRSGFYDKLDGGIGWGFVPHQLIYNSGHYTGFIFGIFLCIIIKITLFNKNNTRSERD